MTRRARPADACIAELTGLTDLAGWPEGMRLIVCTECPTPTAQRRSAAQRRDHPSAGSLAS